MQKLILLVVGAAWAAVLLPPLLRSRMDKRPNSSVTDFRRQLHTLQRTMPGRSMAPMRSMARPLAPSPGRDRPDLRGDVRLDRAGMPAGRSHGTAHRGHGQRPARIDHRSQRQIVLQRRRNVLFMLVVLTGASLFLAFNTRSDAMIYTFVFAAVSLSGYCYKLAQLRRTEDVRSVRPSYYRAA